MFGLLRTILALMVMVFHLFLSIWPLGAYAVFSFYIISGYLMTLVMHESYGYTGSGRASFLINRFLRLYPQYWLAALFSAVLIWSLGNETTINYHKSLFLPVTAQDIIFNVSILFPAWKPNSINPRLVPPAWALSVEIFFYLLICLGISKTFHRVKFWILLSICYVVATFILGFSWESRYFPILAASLPFSIGSSIFFLLKNRLFSQLYTKLDLSPRSLFVLMMGNCIFWMFIEVIDLESFKAIGFYTNIIICTFLVYSLAKNSKIVEINQSLDQLIGDFSYPIYLLHWQAGLFISFLLFGEPFYGFSIRGLISLIGSLILVLMLSLILIRWIDKPIQNIRKKIKSNQSLQRDPLSRP